MADQTNSHPNPDLPSNVVYFRKSDAEKNNLNVVPRRPSWLVPYGDDRPLPTPETMTIAGLLSLYLVSGEIGPFIDRNAAKAAVARISATASNYIFPLIGTRLVSDFSEDDARSFSSTLMETRSREQAGQILLEAKRLFDLTCGPGRRSNPFEHVVRAMYPAEQTYRPLPSDEQVGMMVLAAERLAARADRPAWKGYRVMLRVLVASGVRLPELKALPWDNILFDENAIVIDQRMDVLGVLEPVLAPPAVRQVLLPADVMEILQEWKTHCPESSPENPAKVYRDWTAKRDFVFPTIDGTPILSETFRRGFWHPLMREAELLDPSTGKVSFDSDSLHYQHAVMMLRRGATGEQVNRRLGYSGLLPHSPLNSELASHLLRRIPSRTGY